MFYLRIRVENSVTGSHEVDAIYFCYENVNLIQQFFLRHEIPISHLVWIRDGSGFGGGRLRHDFLMPLMPLLRTRWLFIQKSYFQNLQDDDGLRTIPRPQELKYHLRFQRSRVSPSLSEVGNFQSGGDRVVFCKVENAPIEYHSDPSAGSERRFPATEVSDPVYLWLSCEGWMKFGPFEWLRFDEERRSILGPCGEVATWVGGTWRVPGERWSGYAFSGPTITTSRERPSS